MPVVDRLLMSTSPPQRQKKKRDVEDETRTFSFFDEGTSGTWMIVFIVLIYDSILVNVQL